MEKDNLAWSTKSEIRCRAFPLASGCSAQVMPCHLVRMSISGGDLIEGELCQMREGLLRVKIATRVRSGLTLEKSKQASCAYDVEAPSGLPDGMVRYSLCSVSHEDSTVELTATTWPSRTHIWQEGVHTRSRIRELWPSRSSATACSGNARGVCDKSKNSLFQIPLVPKVAALWVF